jgi:hypothetical protein
MTVMQWLEDSRIPVSLKEGIATLRKGMAQAKITLGVGLTETGLDYTRKMTEEAFIAEMQAGLSEFLCQRWRLWRLDALGMKVMSQERRCELIFRTFWREANSPKATRGIIRFPKRKS